jgi:hypothetical protein
MIWIVVVAAAGIVIVPVVGVFILFRSARKI